MLLSNFPTISASILFLSMLFSVDLIGMTKYLFIQKIIYNSRTKYTTFLKILFEFEFQ